ncbi:MAG: hypothetical protein D6704_05535 [Nitrospirae bacterium]|nr:MAG: hypothetical protein D6704_05535 [Nitrospirota bacterium]
MDLRTEAGKETGGLPVGLLGDRFVWINSRAVHDFQPACFFIPPNSLIDTQIDNRVPKGRLRHTPLFETLIAKVTGKACVIFQLTIGEVADVLAEISMSAIHSHHLFSRRVGRERRLCLFHRKNGGSTLGV